LREIKYDDPDPIYLYAEGETQAMQDEARSILGALDTAYPGHQWAVRVYEGGFFIYNLDFPKNWGMNCKKKFSTASELKRDVILNGGEWLERANLKRGMHRHGEVVQRLEGVPERFQPEQKKESINVEALVTLGKQAAQENGLA
jgi:hypothetical protein